MVRVAAAATPSRAAVPSSPGSAASESGVHAAKPRLLPIELAAGLAAAMARPVAAKIVEIHGPVDAPAPARGDRVADLVDAAAHRVAPACVADHLRHERHPVEAALAVERREDLGRGLDFDHVARPQRPIACRCQGPKLHSRFAYTAHTVRNGARSTAPLYFQGAVRRKAGAHPHVDSTTVDHGGGHSVPSRRAMVGAVPRLARERAPALARIGRRSWRTEDPPSHCPRPPRDG